MIAIAILAAITIGGVALYWHTSLERFMLLTIVLYIAGVLTTAIAGDAYVSKNTPEVVLYEEKLGGEHTKLMDNKLQFTFEDNTGFVRTQMLNHRVEIPDLVNCKGTAYIRVTQRSTDPSLWAHKPWWMLPGKGGINTIEATVILK